MNDNSFFTLTDGRLLAVAGTKSLITLELQHSNDVFTRLNVSPPPYWPPDLNDDDSFGHFLNALQQNDEARIWGLYYLIDLKAERRLVGCGGYVAPPDENGDVEIGYSTLSPYRRNGYATGLCALLIDYAFRDPRVKRITANTYPDLAPSIGVLEKCGFTLAGENEDGTITYELLKTQSA